MTVDHSDLHTAADAVADEPSVAGRARRFRRTRRALCWVVSMGVVYALVCFVQVSQAAGDDTTRPADAIVVLGAAQYDGRPSPQLRGRLDHVVQLWRQGVAPLVVVTGGNQPGDRFTEASASRSYLIDAGVPADAILAEDQGSTTHQSLRAVADVLEARNAASVVLVTDPFHALRSRLTAQEVGLVAVVSPVPDGPNSLRRRLVETGGVAVGRIIGFGRLSDVAG